MPTDIAYEKISSARLKIPLSGIPPPNEPEAEAFVLDKIEQLVKEADGNVVILLDACVVRHHARKETRELVSKTGFPRLRRAYGKDGYKRELGTFRGCEYSLMSYVRIY